MTCFKILPPGIVIIYVCNDPVSNIAPVINEPEAVSFSLDDDLLSGISGANVSNDLISITIADFDRTPQQSQFGVKEILRDDTYSLGDVSDNVALDILLESVSDLITKAEDIVTVDLNTDSTFL